MPEIRFDKITGDAVIVSPERGKRPHDFKLSTNIPSKDTYKADCPFCKGNEEETLPSSLVYKDETNENDWIVRVVPNKYASLKGDIPSEVLQNDFYRKDSGAGTSEVLIESPYHNLTLGKHSHGQMLNIFRAAKERYSTYKEDERIQYIQLFKNFGQIAGASKEHAHWQIMGIPLIPKKVANELECAKKYFKENDTCPYCDIVKNELSEKERIVIESEKFVAFAPYASKYAYETWIVPKQHNSNFESISNDEMDDLANVVHEMVDKIENKFDYPPYNIMLHSMPVKMKEAEFYHWKLQIALRLFTEAGFELGTGVIINPTPPELAAKVLREK